jgi:hypothetical protein
MMLSPHSGGEIVLRSHVVVTSRIAPTHTSSTRSAQPLGH